MTLTLTGSASGSTLSDNSGNYQFSSLAPGGSYTVTPTKAGLALASAGIDTIDAIATQRHFLGIGIPLLGCSLAAGDVNGDNAVNTIDAIAIQRFFLGSQFGVANVGKYQFTPPSRSYSGVVSNQTGQSYDTLVFGDVTFNYVYRPEGQSETAEGDSTSAREVAATVAEVSLPEVDLEQARNNFIAAVETSAIDPKNQLVGFQGDFTFDSTVVTFQDPPVQPAGLTSDNWNVSANVLPGTDRIATLRISAFSNDFKPLSGSGTLFELRMARDGTAGQGTPLIWRPSPDDFIFIDADLNTQKPGNASPGSARSR